jgi:hypothetical protein
MHHRKHMSRDHYPASKLAHAARTYSKHISRDRYLLLYDVTADTENTASSIFACWTVFTELLPGNAFIKSVTIIPEFNLYVISSWIEFWFLTVVPKYLNCATFPKALLPLFMSWVSAAFWFRDRNIHLVFSVFTSRPTSLLASVRVSLFFFMVPTVYYCDVFTPCSNRRDTEVSKHATQQ